MPSVPSVPRIPGVPDPLNRIRIPEDLQAVTSRNPMEDPAGGGLADETVGKLWDAGVSLYGVMQTIASRVPKLPEPDRPF